MKKITLLLSFVSLFWACQKKEYPTFNYSQSAYIHQSKAEAVANTVSMIAEVSIAPQPLLASTSEDFSALSEEQILLESIQSEINHTKTDQVTVLAADQAAHAEMTWSQKVINKKIQKQIKKADSPEKAKDIKAKPDTIALLSLIFGGAGLLLLLAGSGLGLLLGIAGLVMGIIGLSRVKKDLAPSSSKTLALLGTIFGGLVTLIGVIAIAAISAYGFY